MTLASNIIRPLDNTFDRHPHTLAASARESPE
jgi:hypothetical protein